MTTQKLVNGVEMVVSPDGIGKMGDLFVKIEGFVVFIKGVPEEKKNNTTMKVKMVTIKDNCGIAVYLDEDN